MSGRLQTDAFSHSKSDTSGKTFRARDKVSHASYFFIFFEGVGVRGGRSYFFLWRELIFFIPLIYSFSLLFGAPPQKKIVVLLIFLRIVAF